MNEFLSNIAGVVPSAYKKKGKKAPNCLVVNDFLVIERPLEHSLFAKVCEAPPKGALHVKLSDKEEFLLNCLSNPERIVKAVSNCSV